MDPHGWKKAAKLEAETRYQGARGDSVLERRRSLNEDQLRGERRSDADPREIFRRRCRGEREKDGQSLRHSTTSWWTEEKKETNERREEVEERESCRECSEDFLELITPTIINVA